MIVRQVPRHPPANAGIGRVAELAVVRFGLGLLRRGETIGEERAERLRIDRLGIAGRSIVGWIAGAGREKKDGRQRKAAASDRIGAHRQR